MFNPANFLGYFTPHFGSVTLSPGQATAIVPANPARVLLVVGNPGGQAAWVTVDPQVGGGGGLFPLTTPPFVVLTWESLGLLVTMPWFGSTTSAAPTIYWCELLWQPTPDPQS